MAIEGITLNHPRVEKSGNPPPPQNLGTGQADRPRFAGRR